MANKKPAFSKEQLVNSKTYRRYTDILAVILSEDEMYTHDDVKKLIEQFLSKPIIEQRN